MSIDPREQLGKTINSMSTDRAQLLQVSDRLENLRVDYNINTLSGLGNFTGDIQAGFQALSSSVDDVQPNIQSSILPLVGAADINQPPVVAQLNSQVSEDLPGIGELLIVPLQSSNASAVAALTENPSSATAALNHVVIAMPTPEAMATALKSIPNVNIPDSQITEAAVQITSVTPKFALAENQGGGQLPALLSQSGNILGQAEDALQLSVGELNIPTITKLNVSNVLGNVLGSTKNLSSQLNLIQTDLNNVTTSSLSQLSQFKFPGLLQNAVERMTSNARGSITSLVPSANIARLDDNLLNNIVQLVGQGNLPSAAKKLAPLAELDETTIIAKLSEIDNSVFANLVTPVSNELPSVFTSTNLSNVGGSWTGITTDPSSFTSINNAEEMVAELSNVEREITEVIIHSSMTGINQNLQASDLAEVLSRAFGVALPYHYIITRSGVVQRGRPLELELDIPLANGHNLRSIHICMIGGINRPVSGNTNQEDVDAFISGDSFTQLQWRALRNLIRSIQTSISGVEVLGHNDIDRAEQDPGFNVREWASSTFGSRSFLQEPHKQRPPKRSEVIAYQQPSAQTNEEEQENIDQADRNQLNLLLNPQSGNNT